MFKTNRLITAKLLIKENQCFNFKINIFLLFVLLLMFVSGGMFVLVQLLLCRCVCVLWGVLNLSGGRFGGVKIRVFFVGFFCWFLLGFFFFFFFFWFGLFVSCCCFFGFSWVFLNSVLLLAL